jgi:hypothetical protein
MARTMQILITPFARNFNYNEVKDKIYVSCKRTSKATKYVKLQTKAASASLQRTRLDFTRW